MRVLHVLPSMTALFLAVASSLAAAAPVTWHLQGHFTGAATDKPDFIAAISPLLGTRSLSLTLTIDPDVPAGTGSNGNALYRAITASTAQFAGFDTIASPCRNDPSSSELICTVQSHDGVGRPPGGFDPDVVSVFPAIHASAAFDAAAGLNRIFALQFMMFASDFDGLMLPDGSLASALDALTPGRVQGYLGVFATGPGGPFSDRASFEFRLDSISTGASTNAVPEPHGLLLAPLALAAAVAARRRTSRS